MNIKSYSLHALALITFCSLCLIQQSSGQPIGQCISPPAGLIAWWPGDGSTLDIISGRPAILRNGATYAQGLVGQAFLLDGVSSYVEIPNTNAPSFTNGSAFTIELWVFRTSAAFPQHIYGKRTSCGGSTTEWNYQLAIGTGAVPASDIPRSNWTHIASVHTGSQTKIYTNGVFDLTISEPDSTTNTASFLIGISDSCAPFGGLVDELSIYNRALSDAEIQAVYAAGSAGKCKEAQMSIRVSQVEVCWTSWSNATYQLQYRSTLTSNQWAPLLNCILATNGTTCYDDPVLPGQPQRYYRALLTNCVP